MTENNTMVYVVTSGEYSGYDIEGVFTDKILAGGFVDKLNEFYKKPPASGDRARIEEFFLNLPVEKFEATTVRMTKEGSVLEVWHGVGKDSCTYGFDHPGNLMWSSYGKDEKRAIKVANEKRVQLIAKNLWGVDDPQREEERD